MSIQKLPSGRYRAQVYSPRDGKNISVGKVTGGPSTFKTKRDAKAAREQARTLLGATGAAGVTVAQWRDRWLTDPLFTSRHRPGRTTGRPSAPPLIGTRAFTSQPATSSAPTRSTSFA